MAHVVPSRRCTGYVVSGSLRNILVLILFGSLVGCYSYTPIYRDKKSIGSNTETMYTGPAYRQEMNFLGWSWLTICTGGGAYAGYVSGVELEWETGQPEEEKPIANAAIGAATGLGVGILTKAIFKPDIPRVTQENAAEWVRKIDKDLVIFSMPKEGSVNTLSVINRNVEGTYAPKTLSDVQTFLIAFPSSARTGDVLTTASSVLKPAEQKSLFELSTDEDVRRKIALNYLDQFTSIRELHAAGVTFPIIADSAQHRAARSVRSVQSALTFKELYDQVDPILPYLNEASMTDDRKELRLLIDSFPTLPAVDSLKLRYARSANTIGEIREVAELYPEHLPLLEEKTASLASDEVGWQAYLDLFPNGRNAGRFKVQLADATKPPERLSSAVNSSASEYAPVISPDGKMLYFVRRNERRNKGGLDDEDIWYSELKDGVWSLAKQMGYGLNNKKPNAVNTVTPDGNSLLLHGSKYNVPCLITYRTKNGWSEPNEMIVEDFFGIGGYRQSYLSNDAQVLLISNEEIGEDDNDLFVSFALKDGTWTKPKSLGSTINTYGEEASPFLAADGKSLYFSSDGHGGYGGIDLFVTRRLDDTWTSWSEPENLGSRINTAEDDQFFFIPASGRYAYFSRSVDDRRLNMDIYRVTLPPSVRPLPVILIEGKVTASHNNQPLEALIIYEDLRTGQQVGAARTDPTTGAYKIALPAGTEYGFRAEAENYLSISQYMDVTDLEQYEEKRVDLSMIPVRTGERLRLNNLFFEFGSADLRSESFPELNRIASFLNTHPAVTVRIEGHTDSVGTAEDNLSLSIRRAEAVVAYFQKAGISATRLESRGRGEEEPIEENETEEGRRANRRVEFVIKEVK